MEREIGRDVATRLQAVAPDELGDLEEFTGTISARVTGDDPS